jgi:hypothetical protein
MKFELKHRIKQGLLVILSIALFNCSKHNMDDLIDVKIQLNWFPDAEHAYIYYGIDKEIFKEAGFNVEVISGRGSEFSSRALASGSVDFALVGGDSLLAIASQGAEVISLGVIYKKSPVVIYSKKSESINSPQDLYGKTVGVLLGSNTYTQYKGLIKVHSLDTSKYVEKPVDGRSAPIMLNSGEIDALTFYTHYVSGLEKEFSEEYNEIFFSNYFDIYGMSLSTNLKSIDRIGSNGISRFMNAIKKSLEKTIEFPLDALESLERLTNKDINLESKSAELSRFIEMVCGTKTPCDFNTLLTQSSDGWQNSAQTALMFNLISDPNIADNIMYVKPE